MKEIQIKFLHQLHQQIGNEKLLGIELSKILDISQSQAYKKISGESLLNTLQILTICEYYGTTFTIGSKNTPAANEVNFLPLYTGNVSVIDYVKGMEKTMRDLASSNVQKMTCATDDIPFFHLFKYPEITAFKFFFWNTRVRQNEQNKFTFKNTNNDIVKSAFKVHEIYHTIPSVEIWSKNSFMNTLDQIKHSVQTKLLTDRGLSKSICQQLRLTLKDVEKDSVKHAKGAANSILYDWYYNYTIGSITYLAESDNSKNIFLRFNTFNNIHAANNTLCDEVKYWLENLVKDSTGFAIEGSSYFEQAYTNCDELESSF